MKLSQIVITLVEEPVDEPRGEVYKVAVFDSKVCVDTFYHAFAKDAVDEVECLIRDLVSQ